MTHKMNRRTALAAIAAVAVAGPAVAVAMNADPVFAAIERHKAALLASCEYSDAHPEIDNLGSDPGWLQMEEVLDDAALAMVQPDKGAPTTQAGAAALIDYVEEFDSEKFPGSGPDVWPSYGIVDDGVRRADGGHVMDLPYHAWVARAVRAVLDSGSAAERRRPAKPEIGWLATSADPRADDYGETYRMPKI